MTGENPGEGIQDEGGSAQQVGKPRRDYAFFAAHRTEQRFEMAATKKLLIERLIRAGADLADYDFFRGLKVELRVTYRL